MKKVINKGYTLTVTSWENDGDNYNTKSLTVDSIEEAKSYYNLMQLCKSKNSKREKGIMSFGNMTDEFNISQTNFIISFLTDNSVLLSNFDNDCDKDEDFYLDAFQELIYHLLGSSEYYTCRVMESCIVTYSKEDIYVEEIKF